MYRPFRPSAQRRLIAATLFSLAFAAPTISSAQDSRVSIEPIGPIDLSVGEPIAQRIVPRDTDGRVPALFAVSLPDGASLDDNGDGTRTLNWTPAAPGRYTIELVALSASGDAESRRTLEIDVAGDDRDGGEDGGAIGDDGFFIEPLSDQLVSIETALVLRVTPRLAGGGVPSLNVQPMPATARFDDNGDGTRTLVWRPEPGEEGRYTLTFVATDPDDAARTASRSIDVSVVAGDRSEPPMDTDEGEGPDGGDDDEDDVGGSVAAARTAFRGNLVGARSYGCEPGDAETFTTEFVELFRADGTLVSSTWLYEEPDCVTRPLTRDTRLGVESWELLDPVVTDGGETAWQIRYETVQQDNDEFLSGPGVPTFDLVALQEGGVSNALLRGVTPEEAGTALAGPFAATPLGLRADPATREGLLGTWRAACFNGRIVTRDFTETNLVESVGNYSDSDCAEDTFFASTVTTWSIVYGDAVTSVFGQPALRTTIERLDARFDDLVIDSDTPDLPTLGEPGVVFEDIWAVVAGELVIGTCLDKAPGNCGVGDNVPDLLNFNNGNRFFRD